MTTENRSAAATGALYAIGAYGAWGLFPLYWKALRDVEPLQILAHRILWSLVFVAVLLAIRGRWGEVLSAARDLRTLSTVVVTTLLIAVNWLLYIWAVNTGHVLDASLGYFINPLVNVLLGLVVLRERLRPMQWFCVALAACGVVFLWTAQSGSPWIALTLASTFGLYGLFRKRAPVDSLVGLSLETLLLVVPALVFCLARESAGQGTFGHAGMRATALLVLSGVVTAVPLLWFAHAARRLPLSVLGFFQYIAPTGQFLLAVFLYDEAFTTTHQVTFGCIWGALVISSVEGAMQRRRAAR